MNQSKCPNDPTTAHGFFRFDEATIVCAKCGEQRVVDVAALIAKLPQPVVLPCPGPHYPQPITWWWEAQPMTVGDGTGDWRPPNGTTVTYRGDSSNATFGPEPVS